MYTGSKGWLVAELKKLGITKYEEKNLETYKAHVLRSLLAQKKVETK